MDEVLTLAQAAEIVKVSRNTVKAAILNREIPAKNIGRKRRAYWRIRRSALDLWLDGAPRRESGRRRKRG